MGVTVAGAAFLASLVITGWTAVAWVLTPCVLLVLLALALPGVAPAQPIKRFYRRVTRFVQWAWMGQVVLLLEKLFGVQVHVYGDAATKAHERELASDRALWLSNHRTRIDWMLMWSLALRTRTLHQLRIILKAPLRRIPIFGWAMQHFIFIFLQRRWADDQVNLKKLLPFLASAEPESSYLLFPEGTDLSESNVEKSTAFAKKQGLPPRQYSLYPRTTGWTFMFPLLRSQLSAVYDVTMFYVDFSAHERPSEASLLSARMPRTIHFYLERVDVAALRDKSESELAAWLETRFERKEALLKAFYESPAGQLPPGAEPMFQEDQMPAMAAIVAFWLVLVVVTLQFAWVGGLWSLLAVAAVAAGYGISTAFGPGVDGFLVENL